MDAREQRAIIIAATSRIDRENGHWRVPSQSEPNKSYIVDLSGNGSCSCPDNAESGFCCKHIRAVRIVLKRELGMNEANKETITIKLKEKKKYGQDWSAYNYAQKTEKHRFQVLLKELCSGVVEPPLPWTGRRPHPIKDILFAMVFKVYCGFSLRRFGCDLKDAFERGHVSNQMSSMALASHFETARVTPYLNALIVESARPLAAVETTFAVDSTGFSTDKFERWFDESQGKSRKKSVWVKCHIACGTKTNIVTAVRILEKEAGDAPQFRIPRRISKSKK